MKLEISDATMKWTLTGGFVLAGLTLGLDVGVLIELLKAVRG